MNILKELVKDTLLGTEWDSDEKSLATTGLEKNEDSELIVEKTEILKAPIVEQVIKPKELTEVQPVITREREQTEVHEVIQPLHQKEILPATLEEKQLPGIEGEIVEERGSFEKEYNETTQKWKSSVIVEDLQKERFVRKPIVKEIVHKKVIEEIQPFIHKEVLAPHLIKETQPIHERIVEAPRLFQEEFDDRPNWKGARTESGEAVEVQTLTKAPILEEVIRPKEIIEIQPLITREREQTEVHELVQPIREQEILPPVVESQVLPDIERDVVVESGESFGREYNEVTEQFKSSVEVGAVEKQRVLRKPIIQEVIHKRIIEEIQPVIHRETIVPHIVKEILPIHEKIIEAPTLIQQELEEKDLGTVLVGLSTLSPDLQFKKVA